MKISRRGSASFRWLSSASSLIALAGCGSSFTPLERTLPAVPEFSQPVSYRPGKLGESCYVALNRNEGTTRDANARLARFRSWYASVRSDYNPKQRDDAQDRAAR